MGGDHPFRAGLEGTELAGFDDGYGQRGYQGFRHREVIEDYDTGFENGAYSLLEEVHPGLSEATAEMHVSGKSGPEDTIVWLFLPVESKLRWARNGELAGFEEALRSGSTVYTRSDPREHLEKHLVPDI